MSSQKPPEKTFSEIWDPHGADIKSRIKIFSILNKLSIAAPFAVAAGTRSLGKEQLAAITGLSGLSYAHSKVLESHAKKMTIDLIEDQSIPADSEIQNIADKLFAKAGLSEKPVVRIIHAKAPANRFLGPGGDHVTKEANHTLAIVPSGMIKDVTEPTILIGHKALKYLTKAEMAAVLAHETSHALIQGETREALTSGLNKAGTSAAAGITLLGLITNQAKNRGTFSAGATFALLIGELGRSLTFSQLQRSDEDRADRNSLGLFPHKTALLSALNKLISNTCDDLGIKKDPKEEPSGLSKVFNLLSTHPNNSQRETNLTKNFEEVEQFYRENGFDIASEIRAIAGANPDEICDPGSRKSNPPQNKTNNDHPK